MSQVAVSETKEIMRPLRILVPLIKDDLRHGDDAAELAGMPYYKAAGEKLNEAKPQVTGSFELWIKKNFNRSPRQARLYMSYARATTGKQFGATTPFKNLDDFQRRHLGTERQSAGRVIREWREDVDDLAERARRDMERIQEEDLTRKQEREAEAKLGLRLIDIGYKVLAKELHPDRGGSRDAMQRLSRVRDRLKASV